MAKKDFYLLADTETTMDDNVVDFGAILTDKKGRILNQCSVLVHGIFGVEPLWFLASDPNDSIWSRQGQDKRFTDYQKMLQDGRRVLASVAAINRWLERVRGKYNPILTAYNLNFDLGKCANTGIDLTIFERRFCLWYASVDRWAFTKRYRQFILDAHAFNPPTDYQNMSFKTGAETMARFVLNNPDLPNEPHQALEDVIDYEQPILQALINSTKKKRFMDSSLSFNWRRVQVREHFKPK